MPFLESFNLERLGKRLADLEIENAKMRRGPMCDALGLMFFDVVFLPGGEIQTKYHSPKGEEIFGEIPSTYKEALNFVHPSDRKTIQSAGESFVRVRLRHKTGEFHWYFIKCIMSPDRMLGVIFQANRIEGFGLGVDLSP